ncbi:RNA polymerase sigma factor [Actinokineospora spheciospongiae]|nr:RNA polymerase sigma factor [Actinokineospora spheciospongiae]PWW62402.1 RNA polymerase sigma-70 factor (ECF subfamily) [Actinokineospora spheciospongiae]
MAVGDARPDLTGDDAAVVFTRLFDSHADGIHRYLTRRAGPAAADDLVAETFVAAWAGRVGYDPARADVRPWLFGIATNLLRAHWREETRSLRLAARVGDQPLEPPEDPDDTAIRRADADADVRGLAAALSDLPAADREVLLLTAWAELTAVEVAEVLGIPAGTVRSRLHRVRRTLRATAPALAARVEETT